MSEDTVQSMGTGELVRRLVNNLSSLLDREVELVRQEAREDAIHVATGGATLAAGGLLVYTAVVALIVAAILAILPNASPPVATLVVAAVFAIIGAVVGFIGWNRVKVQPLVRTRETLREDVQWAKNQMTSPGR